MNKKMELQQNGIATATAEQAKALRELTEEVAGALTPEQLRAIKDQAVRDAVMLLTSEGRHVLDLSPTEGNMSAVTAVDSKISEATASLELVPAFLQDSIKTAILQLQRQKASLLLDTDPVSVAKHAFADFIARLPIGSLGSSKIIITTAISGHYLIQIKDTAAAVAVEKKEKDMPFPLGRTAVDDSAGFLQSWSSYGYPVAAQKICEKLGYEVGSASAYAILCKKAKEAGKKSMQLFLLEKNIVATAAVTTVA